MIYISKEIWPASEIWHLNLWGWTSRMNFFKKIVYDTVQKLKCLYVGRLFLLTKTIQFLLKIWWTLCNIKIYLLDISLLNSNINHQYKTSTSRKCQIYLQREFWPNSHYSLWWLCFYIIFHINIQTTNNVDNQMDLFPFVDLLWSQNF